MCSDCPRACVGLKTCKPNPLSSRRTAALRLPAITLRRPRSTQRLGPSRRVPHADHMVADHLVPMILALNNNCSSMSSSMWLPLQAISSSKYSSSTPRRRGSTRRCDPSHIGGSVISV